MKDLIDSKIELIDKSKAPVRGFTQVLLYDKDNNVIQETNSENAFLIHNLDGHVIKDLLHLRRNDSSISYVLNKFRYILLTNEDSPEDPNKLWLPKPAKIIGYAENYSAHSGPDTKRGTINSAECSFSVFNYEKGTVSYNFVWDFPTHAANGDINKVCFSNENSLTNPSQVDGGPLWGFLKYTDNGSLKPIPLRDYIVRPRNVQEVSNMGIFSKSNITAVKKIITMTGVLPTTTDQCVTFSVPSQNNNVLYIYQKSTMKLFSLDIDTEDLLELGIVTSTAEVNDFDGLYWVTDIYEDIDGKLKMVYNDYDVVAGKTEGVHRLVQMDFDMATLKVDTLSKKLFPVQFETPRNGNINWQCGHVFYDGEVIYYCNNMLRKQNDIEVLPYIAVIYNLNGCCWRVINGHLYAMHGRSNGEYYLSPIHLPLSTENLLPETITKTDQNTMKIKYTIEVKL